MEDLKKMTLLDIIAKWQSTETVIKSYDQKANTCLCCNHLFESLESVCEKYDIPVTEISLKLNESIKKSKKS